MPHQLARSYMGYLLLLVLLCSISSLHARKAPKIYVALGDSYAAGFGAGIPLKPRNVDSCWRHTLSYPRLFRYNDVRNMPEKIYDFTCGDVDTYRKISEQISDIPGDAELISFTWGAEYIHLPDTVYQCEERLNNLCAAALAESEQRALNRTGESFDIILPRLVDMILAKAPGAVLVMLGYPRFMGSPVKDCVIHEGSPSNRFQGFKDRLNRLSLALNLVMLRVFDQHSDRVYFGSPDSAFAFHRYCDSDPFFHPWKPYPEFQNGWSGYGYFNPTGRGQELYKNLLVDAWEFDGKRKRIA